MSRIYYGVMGLSILILLLSSQTCKLATTADMRKLVHYDMRVLVLYAGAFSRGKPAASDQVADYKYAGIRWLKFPVIFKVNPSGSGLEAAAVARTISLSAEEWDKYTSKELMDNFVGTTDRVGGRLDGENIISFAMLTKPDAIAVTFVWFSSDTRQVVECDMVFNTNFRWSLSGDASKMDVQNIATHEFGHFIVLEDLYDSRDAALTMCGYSRTGETSKRTLGRGDILGLKIVYGP